MIDFKKTPTGDGLVLLHRTDGSGHIIATIPATQPKDVDAAAELVARIKAAIAKGEHVIDCSDEPAYGEGSPGTPSTFELPRTGEPILRITGEKVTDVSGLDASQASSVGGGRYHRVELYRTPTDWVVWIAYVTEWSKNESNHYTAVRCPDPSHIAKALAQYEPTAHVFGWPVGTRNRDQRQAALLEDVRRRWRDLCAHLIDAAGIVEEG